MTNEAVIQAVFQDEAFVRGLFEMETPQEVQAALRGRDVEMTVDEIKQIRDLTMKRINNGEALSDADLENVTGGIATAVGIAIGLLGIAVCGALLGGLVGGSVAGGLWLSEKNTW